MTPSNNADAEELGKFSDLAGAWWDPEGPCAPLHAINPLRIDFIRRHVPLVNRRVADVGCGGGILTEALAREGAEVLGTDLSEEAIEAAEQHCQTSGVRVDYRIISAEALAAEQPAHFDVVTCLEMLEHVPDPASVVDACARLVRPGGDVFFSTLNRNPKSFLFAIVGAEYLLHLLPRGTHTFASFIRPSELDRWARQAGLVLNDLTGLQYNPLTRQYRLGEDVDVNYLAHYRKTGSADGGHSA